MWKNERVFTVNCKKANYQMPKSNIKTYPKMDISTTELFSEELWVVFYGVGKAWLS